MKCLIVSHQQFHQEKRNMFWCFRMSLYSILTNITRDHGLQKISKQSRRREMVVQCMSPTSYLRWSDGLNYQKIRSPSNLHCLPSFVCLHLKHKRLPTPERASMNGGISHSWSISSSIQSRFSSTHIWIVLGSLSLIASLLTRALWKMPSMSTI